MPNLAIKPEKRLAIKYDIGIVEVPIKEKSCTHTKILIYSSLFSLTNQTNLPKTKESIPNQLMFLRCLLYLRDYLSKVGYSCTSEEMETTTALVARRLWKILDENNFDQKMELVSFTLEKILFIDKRLKT